MPARLQENAYGKCDVRLVKVARGPERHEVKDLTVSTVCTGDFEAAYVAGDNRNVVPTDTMKNIIYAMAADHPLTTIEEFGLSLAERLLEYKQFTHTEIAIEENLWQHLRLGGHLYPASFTRTLERRTAQIQASRAGVVVRSGIADLLLLKTSGSAFAGFHHDPYTTLAETADRLLQTVVQATWGYVDGSVVYTETWEQVRQRILESFARHASRSVQHTLYTIGEAILDGVPAVADVHLSLPNQHCLAVDLKQFGLENRNEVFLPVFEPSGFITAYIVRA